MRSYAAVGYMLRLSGNKMEKMANVSLVRVKRPIHLFTYSPFPSLSPCLEIKCKMDNFSLVGVKTPIHLFTYSPFCSHLSIRHFRRVGPNRRGSLPAHQNWAYATKPSPTKLHRPHADTPPRPKSN